MDAISFFGRVAILAVVFLILNVDYTAVMQFMYQKFLMNHSDWNPNDHVSKPTVQKKSPLNTWVHPRVPGLHGGSVMINMDEEIERDTIEKIGLFKSKYEIVEVLREHCLPKLICEVSANPDKIFLTPNERDILNMIKQTNILIYGTTGSKYLFAVHMGQLIRGVDGQGCHNFYPSCPFQSYQVLNMIRRPRSKSTAKPLP